MTNSHVHIYTYIYIKGHICEDIYSHSCFSNSFVGTCDFCVLAAL